MYKLVYKGIRGRRCVARFETIEQAQEWIANRLRMGLPVVNPQLTKE